MTYRTLIGIAGALLAVASPASAQEEGVVSLNLGGGFTIPSSDLRDTFGTGGNFQIGVDVRVAPLITLQAEYGYNKLGSKDLVPGTATAGVVTSIPLTANHSMHDGDFNVLVGPSRKDQAVAPYGIVGVGVYHRIVNVTTPAVGIGTVCDPWLFICYPTPVAVDQIIGERTNTEFGFNVGGGVTLRVTELTKFYAEFRYIWTNGPSFTDAAGASRTANGHYFPFTFGFKFYS